MPSLPQLGSPAVEYSDWLMANDPEALHHHVSTCMEKAMGKALPQMEVRIKDLSLTAQVTVSGDTGHELPTLARDTGNIFREMLPGRTTQVTKVILHSINAVFEPGTMTLVLGQPGSGKSSLLKVLSGRFPYDKTTTMEGDITYNGVPQAELNKRLPQFVSYVPQRDRHFPTLTVKETLAFAHECCGSELSSRDEAHFTQGSAEENKAALEAARAMYRHYPEIVTQQLGLEHCQDTIVGDSMVRGVSGGERKRVTTGEMEFGNKFVTLMDEISTGLDSAATFDIVKTQRSVARKLRKTVVMALLQPSPEVFDLFDNVLILNDGYVMYHGPREQALPYFESLGFKRPMGRDVADFLMDLGTMQQARYEVATADKTSLPRMPHEFAQSFQLSSLYSQMLNNVHSAHDPVLLTDVNKHFDDVPEFHQTFWQSVWTLMKRDAKTQLRNGALLKGRAAMVVVVGLLYASLFYQFDSSKVQVVLGTVYCAILYLALGQVSQLPTFMAAREIFYKQRGANFYRTSAYVTATSLSQIPLAIVETIVFGTMVYWMCGFVQEATAFVMFLVLLFATSLAFTSWVHFLSAISPNLHVGEPLSMLSLLFFILFAGFIITKDNIPDYFVWVYWMNPISWCLRALAINQFRSAEYNVCKRDGLDYCKTFGMEAGEYLLSVFQIQSEKEWLWYGVAFMMAAYLLFMVITAFILEYVRYESPEHVTIDTAATNSIMFVGTGSELERTDDYNLVATPRDVAIDANSMRHEPQYVPVTLAFTDLRYSVPNPANEKESIELLKGISGFAKPGSITALMGSSGAGKTTLMDVIAGRKTGGKIEGQILLNGYPATDLAIRRSTGYCEQMDFHTDSTTFREALVFSAFLRQGADVPDEAKYDTVEEVLDLLDLRPIADKIVRGSSMEQMKRLTIGVELAAQPSVLFLDEPTSGLDARSAKLIMDGVRKVANTGRTVVCTIHQPSWEVFQVFDSLLLLKKGGETVYFGELGRDASELIAYFESIEGVSKLVEGYNPATWMLEVIGAGVGNTAGQDTDFVQIFNASRKKASLDTVLAQDGVCRPAPGSLALSFSSKRAASSSTQAKFLMKRSIDLYWRLSDYNLTRVVVFILFALIFGLSFLNVDYDTYQGINGGVGMVFVTTVFLGVVSFESVLPVTFEQRTVYYRERAAQTYNALWFFLGAMVVEIPYVFGSCLVFCAIFFPMAGFSGAWLFVLYWVHTSLHVLLQTYMGILAIYTFPSVEVAMIVSVMLCSIFFLFMGYIPPAESIPGGYKWLYHVVPPKYSFSILNSLLFGECEAGDELGCKPLRGELPPAVRNGTTVQSYLDAVFNVKRDEMWQNFSVVMGYILLVAVLALIAVRFVNHQKR